jgi:uncharacterized damage-inducible protein DinB
MNSIELIAKGLKQSHDMLMMTLSDFTEAEMLTRPCPGANHPLWQIGHLCVAETFITSTIKPGSMPELPAGFKEKFENNKKTNLVDDPKQLASKAQVLELFGKTHQALIAFTKSLSDADLDKPAPEKFKSHFATLGELMVMQVTHVSMHMGQIQVARRKLGKPVMF